MGAVVVGTCAAFGCEELVTVPDTATGNARRKRYCSTRCRVRAHKASIREGRVALPKRVSRGPADGVRIAPADFDEPTSFTYADPPYPGRAHLYPENEEVDHEQLVRELCERSPAGWALSTGSESLQAVLALCPPGVRVGAWRRQYRPYLERARGWEPVIFCGGRRARGVALPDAIEAPVPAGWDLPGRKPPAFFLWVLAMLGARAGDTFVEPFPGSGGGAEAWGGYRGPLEAVRDLERMGAFALDRRGRRQGVQPFVRATHRCSACGAAWNHVLLVPVAITGQLHCGRPMAVELAEVR